MEEFSPPRHRKEWVEIIQGKRQFKKYSLQLMSDRTRRELDQGTKSAEEAIDEMRRFFEKYKNAFRKDLVEIFGEW